MNSGGELLSPQLLEELDALNCKRVQTNLNSAVAYLLILSDCIKVVNRRLSVYLCPFSQICQQVEQPMNSIDPGRLTETHL